MTIATDEPIAMTTTTLTFVRHGETDWNLDRRYQGTSDVPLNGTGREQARIVAEAIGGDGWDVIISSPLARAMDTARAIAKIAGIETIIEDPDARERAYGDAEGLTLAEREQRWPDRNWPGLEEWDHVAKRGSRLIARIVAEHPAEKVMIVCHGGLINAVLATLSKGDLGTGKTVIENTSRTSITFNGEGWTIGEVSVADHLHQVAVG